MKPDTALANLIVIHHAWWCGVYSDIEYHRRVRVELGLEPDAPPAPDGASERRDDAPAGERPLP